MCKSNETDLQYLIDYESFKKISFINVKTLFLLGDKQHLSSSTCLASTDDDQ